MRSGADLRRLIGVLRNLRPAGPTTGRMPRLALPLLAALALLCLLGACNSEQRNAAFCCLTAADCAQFGISGETLLCQAGLQCVQNTCVTQSCETSGCTAAAPVCDTVTDQCTGCTDSGQCTGADVCDPASGACVGCVTSADCDAATPVCGADQACRTCTRDSDCASNACADDGTCVAEENVVYIAPNGIDTGTCARTQPCKLLDYASARASATRSHVVAKPGVYTYYNTVRIASSARAPIWIHGNGSTHSGDHSNGFMIMDSPVVLRDVELTNEVGLAVSLTEGAVLERATVRGQDGASISGRGTLRDVRFSTYGYAVDVSAGSASLERVGIRGGEHGIRGSGGAVIEATNVEIAATSVLAIDLDNASGRFEFITVTRSSTYGAGTTSIRCTRSATVFRSSIIWNPETGTRPHIEGPCEVPGSIVGPVGYGGAMNVDPQFANPGAGTYKLSSASPARDLAETGPPIDLEGVVRPRGSRFDLGAHEGTP